MADTKISALPASTTPLAGTEVLPIVQSSTTRQVSVANLTAGRAISAAQLTLTTGNLIVASGQGIDFSATPGTGTSELLSDYEEGTWSPIDSSGAGLTFGGVSATYTKIGRQVTCNLLLSYPITADTSVAEIGGLPFAAGSYGATSIQGFFCVRNSSFSSYGLAGAGGASSFIFDKNSGTANALNADLSNTFFAATIIYQV